MNNILHLIQSGVSSKIKRTEQCFDYLNKKKINLCDFKTGALIDKKNLDDMGMSKYSNIQTSFKDYCLMEFKKANFIACDNSQMILDLRPPIPESVYCQKNIYHGIDGVQDIFKIPNTYSKDVISIGTSFKVAGTSFKGCKFIITNFNTNDNDIIDFTNFLDISFEDIYPTKFIMNDKYALAIHLFNTQPEYLVCLYDYNDVFPENSLEFAIQETD